MSDYIRRKSDEYWKGRGITAREPVEWLVRSVVEDCLAQVEAATDHAEAAARLRALGAPVPIAKEPA